MMAEILKTEGAKVKGVPRLPLTRLPMQSDFKRPRELLPLTRQTALLPTIIK
jgi:hypothetical protein